MRRSMMLAGLAWPVFATAQAQSPPRAALDSGAAVQVLTRWGGHVEGRLVQWSADRLVLRLKDDGISADTLVSLVDVVEVEARMRRRTAGSALKGFGIGAVAGAAAGAAIAGASMTNCQGDMCGMAVLWIPVVGAVGGVGGLLIGAVRATETWDVVWRAEVARP